MGPRDRATCASSRTLGDDALLEHLGKLAYRERRVLELRYGLTGDPPRTLDSVALRFGLTPREIRTTETQSPAKLRAASEQPPGA